MHALENDSPSLVAVLTVPFGAAIVTAIVTVIVAKGRDSQS